jgi:hypothetical protein
MKNQTVDFLSRLLIRRRLSALHNLIVNEDDHLLFNDASRCLISGAYRSAYITAWLSAAASIRSKLEIISPRDSHVGQKLREIEQAEKESNPIDKLLLDASKKFGMISPDDYESLENIRKMRNVYAHPRRAAPSADEVLGAIGTVVRTLLSKPALLRYGYASDVIRGVFEEPHFLDDVEERVHSFGKEFTRRIDPLIYPWVLKEIIERLEAIWDDPSLVTRISRGEAFLYGFLFEIAENLAHEEWGVVELARTSPRSISIVFSNPNIWSFLPFQAREIIIGYLCESIMQQGITIGQARRAFSGPLPSQAFSAAQALTSSGVIDERESERLSVSILEAPLERLAQYEIPLQDWIDRIMDALKSYNWYTQNPAIDALITAGSEQIETLSDQQQELLGRNILQSAEGGSNSAENLIRMIAEDPTPWTGPLIVGLLNECFIHESGYHRTKCRMLSQVIACILGRQEIDAISLVSSLGDLLEESPPKEDESASFEFGNAIEIINNRLAQYQNEGNLIISNLTVSFNRLIAILGRLLEEHTRGPEDDSIPF